MVRWLRLRLRLTRGLIFRFMAKGTGLAVVRAHRVWLGCAAHRVWVGMCCVQSGARIRVRIQRLVRDDGLELGKT